MPAKNKAKISKPTKKTAAKATVARVKKLIPKPVQEEIKGWKDAQKATFTLEEFEAILDDAFDAVDKIWIDALIPYISKLDSISSELTKIVNEYRQRDIQIKYTQYDKVKETIFCRCNWKD